MTPDVSVIVAVYNAMPYLTRCLDSLAGQSIGRDRMEVIAVDDGSTDGGGEVLDRSGFRVVHQAGSGGPAAPNNLGLSMATGRYVFFVGADDYLGSEALERLVTGADDWSSDVVLGRMEGTGGRYVHQGVFARSAVDIGLEDSKLPWSLSNCKLFRRSMLEAYGLRFRESMPVCSDQPFTIEACLRARRISVLADYTYYYAVRRPDTGNITYRVDPVTLLECTEELMHSVASMISAGERRDAVLTRHFAWELGKLLRDDFLALERPVQEKIGAAAGRLADQYLTSRIASALNRSTRRRVRAAQRGGADAVRRNIARRGLSLVSADWKPDALALTLTSVAPIVDERLVGHPPDGFRVRLPIAPLFGRRPARYTIRIRVDLGGESHEVPVPFGGRSEQVRRWHSGRPYRLSLIGDRRGRLVLAVAPIRLTRVIRRRLARLLGPKVGAMLIISDDLDLTSMSPWRGTPILRPREFIAKTDAMRRHHRRGRR